MVLPIILALFLWPAANTDGFLIKSSQQDRQSLHYPTVTSSSSSSPALIRHQHQQRRETGSSSSSSKIQSPWPRFAAPSDNTKISSAKVSEMASFVAMQLLEKALKAELGGPQTDAGTVTATKTKDPPAAAPKKKSKDDADFDSLFDEEEAEATVVVKKKKKVKKTKKVPAPTTTQKVEPSSASDDDDDDDHVADTLFEAKEADPTIKSEDDFEAALLDQVYDLQEGQGPEGEEVTVAKPPPTVETSKPPAATEEKKPATTTTTTSPVATSSPPILGEALVPDIISKDFGKPLDVLKSGIPPLRESSIPKRKPKEEKEEETTAVDDVVAVEEQPPETTLAEEGEEEENTEDDDASSTSNEETEKEVDDEKDKEEVAAEASGDDAPEVTKSEIKIEEEVKVVENPFSAQQEAARRKMLESRLTASKRERIKRKAMEVALQQEEAEKSAIEATQKAEEEAKQKAEKEAKQKAEEEARRKAELEAKAEEEAKKKAEEEAKAEEARKKAEEEAKEKAEREARLKFEAEEEEARQAAAAAAAEAKAEEAQKKAEEEAKENAEREARLKFEAEEEEARQAAAAAAAAKEKAEKEEIDMSVVVEAAESIAAEGQPTTSTTSQEEPDKRKKFVGKFLSRVRNFVFRRIKKDSSQLTENDVVKTSVPSTIMPSKRAEAIQALKQPKSAQEEQQLQEKYASMDVEDRAFTILYDLGMIDMTPDPNDPSYDHSKDDEDCDQFWLWG